MLSGLDEKAKGWCLTAGNVFFGNEWGEGRQTSKKATTGHCPEVPALHANIFYLRGHDTAGYSELICDKPGEKQE